MGLDAAVNRRLEELPFTMEDLRFVAVDPKTGQVDLEDAVLSKAWILASTTSSGRPAVAAVT